MQKSINVSLTSGIDPFLRIVSILRKKGFNIENISFSVEDEQRSNLIITLNEKGNLGLNEAMLQVKKVNGVNEIKVLKGDN